MTKLYHFLSRRLFWLALVSIVLMAASQLLGRYVWQLELFSHYVPHVAALVLLAALLYPKPKASADSATFKRSPWGRVVLAIVGLLLETWSLQPFSFSNLAAQTTLPTVIAYQNVNIGNPNPESALQHLVKLNEESFSQPEVVALVEAGGKNWQTALNTLGKRYPVHCGVNASSPFAMQIYASDVNATCEIMQVLDFPLAKLTLPAQSSRHNGRIIYVAHPPPPISQSMAHARNTYLDELATLIKADNKQSVMVVGDFNLSAFSPIYRDFMSSVNISDATTNHTQHSIQPTTLKGLPTWLPFAIGIDHVLVSNVLGGSVASNEGVNVKTHAQGWHGSDHRGFWIEWF